MKRRLVPVFTSMILVFLVVIALVFVPFEASSDGQDGKHLASVGIDNSVVSQNEDESAGDDFDMEDEDGDLGKEEEFQPSQKRAELI